MNKCVMKAEDKDTPQSTVIGLCFKSFVVSDRYSHMELAFVSCTNFFYEKAN